MAEENKLVTVAKAGEPKLKILQAHLAEHVKLGWAHVEDEVPAKIEDDKKSDDSKGAGKKA